MAPTTAKITELPLRNVLPLSATSSSSSSSHATHSLRLLVAPPKVPHSHSLIRHCSSSLRTTTPRNPDSSQMNARPHSSPWLNKWPPSLRHRIDEKPPGKVTHSGDSCSEGESRYLDRDRGESAIERIVLRLRNLGLGSDDEEEGEEFEEEESRFGVGVGTVTGEERLGDLLQREWVRPDSFLGEDEKHGRDDVALLPWEKEAEGDVEKKFEGRKKVVKAPTLAELTIEDEELRRLRRMGMRIRERISVAKAGITQTILGKIHDKWRKEELVRIKFHEVLARDMKTAHEIVEVGSLLDCFPVSQ